MATISNNSSSQFALNVGENDLYIWPVGDSSNPYFTFPKFVVEDREVYSLFLGGTEGGVKNILIKEDIPYWTDSCGGIRFVNLSPNSPPLNINLLNTPNINEVSNLAYTQHTDFKKYPALASTIYGFQIRNANTGNLLLTYNFSATNLIPRFSNLTLVIRGLVGGAGSQAFAITRVTQDR